jgi:hypothetical protein
MRILRRSLGNQFAEPSDSDSIMSDKARDLAIVISVSRMVGTSTAENATNRHGVD